MPLAECGQFQRLVGSTRFARDWGLGMVELWVCRHDVKGAHCIPSALDFEGVAAQDALTLHGWPTC